MLKLKQIHCSSYTLAPFLEFPKNLEEQHRFDTSANLSLIASFSVSGTITALVRHRSNRTLFKASDFCQIGDTFILTRLEGSERKYNGCWAIAREHRDFTIAVDVHDNTIAVKPDNLDPIDLPDVRRQLPQTLKRIRSLRSCDSLDRCAYTVLESLGRQTYLTDVEEGLLQWLENHYKIKN